MAMWDKKEDKADFGNVIIKGRMIFYKGVRVANIYANGFYVDLIESNEELVIKIKKTKQDEVMYE